MLKHVVRDWLSRIKDERELDSAFVAYLGAAGYRDVHFTHGPQELGKDFIAKLGSVQYAFQSKAGDIATPEWRAVREQMWEAATIGISHPAFDSSLSRRAVLVLTGELRGGSREQIDKFNEELASKGYEPIEVWHNEELIQRFTDTDPATVYPPNVDGYAGYGAFFTTYGEALSAALTPRRIEKHSRAWLADSYDRSRLLIPGVEASVIANASAGAGELYEAFQTRLGLVRTAADAAFAASGTADQDFFDLFVGRALEAAVEGARQFVDEVWRRREGARDKKLIHVAPSPISYPVLCFRLGEALSLVIFCTAEPERAEALARLRKIVVIEAGFEHPLGDVYTVSIVAIVRALLEGDESNVTREYLRRVSSWVLNMYSKRSGLASVWSDEANEVKQLIGSAINEVDVPQVRESFLVTALLDLCVFAEDRALYGDIENDLRVHEMTPHYYRPLDTRGQFRVDGEDVVQSINVHFQRSFDDVAAFQYGEHLIDEPRQFSLCKRFGPRIHLALSLLLRDRYFPTTWAWPAEPRADPSTDP